jgi:purine-cytosine permease-like protein
LALQVITPNWPRWKVTLIAGFLTTILSCFPIFFVKLLDYVAIYGLVLMPMGAIVLAEHWLFPLLKIEQFQTDKKKKLFNGRALIVWASTLLVCFFLPIHLFFRWLPGYVLALFFYVILHIFGKKRATKSQDAREPV